MHLALGLAYAAFRFGRRTADKSRTFGYMRFEVIAGLINSLTLFGIVGWIVYEAIVRFQSPQPVLAGTDVYRRNCWYVGEYLCFMVSHTR